MTMHGASLAAPVAGLWALAGDGPRCPDVPAWARAQLAGPVPADPVWFDDAVDAYAQGRRPYAVHNGIAIIGVKGVLLKSFPVLHWEAATGYQQIQWQAEIAAADPNVRAIALAVDSFGGMVDGLFSLTPVLRTIAAVKPMAAVVEGAAFSAGYAIAAAAGTIAAHPIDGGVGSIGVRAMHIAMHRAYAEAGFDVTEIAAGARKMDMSEWQPLGDDVRARWQADVEEWRQMFAADVVAGRPGLTLEAVLATEAASFATPSQMREALQLGLVDALDLDPFAAFEAALG